MRLSIIDPAAVERTLLIKTPKAEKTTENPSTKNTVFNMTFVLLIVRVVPVFEYEGRFDPFLSRDYTNLIEAC